MISVNEYFDGTVKSLGYLSQEGKSTIGVMENGHYTFGTASHETMTVIQGTLYVKLSGENNFKSYTNGQSFEVPANSSFEVESKGQSSYLCTYK